MSDRYKIHGAFSWNELMTTDVESAKKFYTEIFGWEFEEFPMEGMSYSVIKAGGKEMGGMMTLPPEAEGAPPHWGAYVTVEDVDATYAKALELGGDAVVLPTDIPEVGRLCMFRDPQGAVIAAITYLEMED